MGRTPAHHFVRWTAKQHVCDHPGRRRYIGNRWFVCRRRRSGCYRPELPWPPPARPVGSKRRRGCKAICASLERVIKAALYYSLSIWGGYAPARPSFFHHIRLSHHDKYRRELPGIEVPGRRNTTAEHHREIFFSKR